MSGVPVPVFWVQDAASPLPRILLELPDHTFPWPAQNDFMHRLEMGAEWDPDRHGWWFRDVMAAKKMLASLAQCLAEIYGQCWGIATNGDEGPEVYLFAAEETAA